MTVQGLNTYRSFGPGKFWYVKRTADADNLTAKGGPLTHSLRYTHERSDQHHLFCMYDL